MFNALFIVSQKKSISQNATNGGSVPDRRISQASWTISPVSHPVGKPEEITYHLNDLLRTTLATVSPAGLNFSQLTSFGQPLKSSTSGSTLGTAPPSSPDNPVPTNNRLPPSKH